MRPGNDRPWDLNTSRGPRRSTLTALASPSGDKRKLACHQQRADRSEICPPAASLPGSPWKPGSELLARKGLLGLTNSTSELAGTSPLARFQATRSSQRRVRSRRACTWVARISRGLMPYRLREPAPYLSKMASPSASVRRHGVDAYVPSSAGPQLPPGTRRFSSSSQSSTRRSSCGSASSPRSITAKPRPSGWTSSCWWPVGLRSWRPRNTGTEFGIRLDGDGEERVALPIEQLSAIGRPQGLDPAAGVPLLDRPRSPEGTHPDLVVTRLVGDVGEPARLALSRWRGTTRRARRVGGHRDVGRANRRC